MSAPHIAGGYAQVAKYSWACGKSWKPFILLLLQGYPNGQLGQDMHCLEVPATDYSARAPDS